MSNKEKREFAEAMLAAEGQFDVCARTGAPFVTIPKYLQHEPYVTLTFGLALPIPIDHFCIEGPGISGTLHFGSFGHSWCRVRWEAVRVIRAPSGLGRLWTGDGDRAIESKPDAPVQVVRLPGTIESVKFKEPSYARLGGLKTRHLRLIQGGKGRPNPSGDAA